MLVRIHRSALWLVVAVFIAGCGAETPTGEGDNSGFGVEENANSNGESQNDGEEGERCVETIDGDYVCPFGCRDDDRWPSDWHQHARRLVDEINKKRTEGVECAGESMPSVEPVELNPTLVEAARCHAQDMGENEFFAHEGSNGSTEVERADEAGYSSEYVGENLAKGQRNPRDVVEGWIESEGHCVNLMHAEYRETGAAFVEVGGTTYWAQTYGRDL